MGVLPPARRRVHGRKEPGPRGPGSRQGRVYSPIAKRAKRLTCMFSPSLPITDLR